MRLVISFLVALLLTAASAAGAEQGRNFCPNPGAEEGGGKEPGGWKTEGGPGEWAADEVHSGKRSLKIASKGGPTIGWLSEMIPLPRPGCQFFLSVWAKMQEVSGKNGAFIGFYHTNEKGERIGQSGGLVLGGAGQSAATEPWRQYVTVSNIPPEVKGIRVNLRLYGAAGAVWFDDVEVCEYRQGPLLQARPLRKGIRLRGDASLAIVSGTGAEALATEIQSALRARGCEAPVISNDKARLSDLPPSAEAGYAKAGEKRDLIILGNLVTSKASEYLYLNSYTYEDLYFPGKGGYVLRPLINPLGTGANMLVVGASDDAGLRSGVGRLLEAMRTADETLDIPLIVKTGEGYLGLNRYPWPGSGPRAEMAMAGAYLKSGDLEHARKYRERILKDWFIPDERLFSHDSSLHLFYVTKTMSWGLMESCGVFSDEERLRITNQLLKMLRSNQGYGYSGLGAGMRCRENHATRAARAFYFGWRHFDKYYRDQLPSELSLWRRKLQDFWASCFACSRSYEDSLSQHALGGSLDNTLDIGFMEPEWSREFFQSGRARQMGERCIAICNNMGQTVLLGDTSPGDYPSSVFSKLAYFYRDGRYQFMIEKRGLVGASTDEPLRGFAINLTPVTPEDHIGLEIIPADPIYFGTALRNRAGVPFEKAFDKLTFRSGFSPDDEYLMLDGVAGGSHSYDDANTVGEFSANDRRWLCEIDIFNGPTMSFHNAVTVARDGLGAPEVPQAAELVARAAEKDFAYTATRLPHYNGVAWTRHITWLPRKYVFVLDELTAEEPGEYSFVLGWRSLGEPKLAPGLFVSTQDDPPRAALSLDGSKLLQAAAQNSGKKLSHLSNYNALFYRADAVGDYVETKVNVPAANQYELIITVLKYTKRGIIEVLLDGQPLGKPIDLWTEQGALRESISLGRRQVTQGEHTLRFSAVGKNPNSDGHTFAVCQVDFCGPEEKETFKDSGANRFYLRFPEEVPATLDRDTETLGKYLPFNPHAQPVLNIVEQSMGRALRAGEAACFQNLFSARVAPLQLPCEIRRLNEHCALLRDGSEIALIGASVSGVSIRVGSLDASGKMFYISPTRVVLHEATASLAGQPLLSGKEADSAAVQKELQRAWDETRPGAAPVGNPWENKPILRAKWTADLPALPLSLTAVRGPDGTQLAVGMESGLVRKWNASGRVLGEFKTGGPVHSLCACDLNGDGIQELLVGSDDEHLYALDSGLSELWKYKVPFLREEQHWMWWTLGTSKVRKVHADDINGDGKPEILLGVGNMHLHCLDSSGKELWRFRTDHGTCTTIITAEVYGEGKWSDHPRKRVLAGNGLSSSNGTCWVLDEKGRLLRSYFNGSWCTSLPAIAVSAGSGPASGGGDLHHDGRNTIFCGNNRGDVRAYPAEEKKPVERWIRNLTRPVRSLTILPGRKENLLAVGSDSGYLCAFNEEGKKAWGLPLSSAIFKTGLVQHAVSPPLPFGSGPQVRRLAAACKDGKVFLVSTDGRLISYFDCKARSQDMITADLDGDGTDEIIVATSGPNRLWAALTK